MKDLIYKAFGGLLFLVIILATSLFLPAWTLDYWEARVFLAVFFFPVLGITLYLIVAVGDIFVAMGLLIVFFVFKEDSFASGTIEVGTEQTVISTGLYALVRHPMYLGVFVMLLGVPLALGSWWGLLTVIPIMVIVVWILLDEETFLEKNLPGYLAYRNNVKYRLVPFIW
jgi:protein-S-isoprenylcysteine O-methyltransferase Ste14